jgi:hypothetical protein
MITGFVQPKPGGTRKIPLSDQFDLPLGDLFTVMCVCNKAQFESEPIEPPFTTVAFVLELFVTCA